jgi:ribokinase
MLMQNQRRGGPLFLAADRLQPRAKFGSLLLVRIFVSSTYSDLIPYRDAIDRLVRRYGEVFVGMEYFGARSETPLEVCLEAVGRSDVVIVLVGSLYGSIAYDGLSYTHLEVQHAERAGLPLLVFVQRSPEPVSASETVRRNALLRSLSRYTWAYFDDTASLVTEVAAAFRDFETRDGRKGPSDAWEEILCRARSAANLDCLTVSAHNVDRIYTVDLVAADYETRVEAPVVAAGGSGANTIAGLARLGTRTAVAGIVGEDDDGSFLRDALAQDGIKSLLAPAAHQTLPTGSTTTYTDVGGRRSIYVFPGINERFAVAAKQRTYRLDLDDALRTSRIVHFSSFTRSAERGLQEKLLNRLPDETLFSFTPGALYCKLGLDRLAPFLGRANLVFLYERQLDALLEHEVGGRELEQLPLNHKVEHLYAWKVKRRSREPLAVIIKNSAGDSDTTRPQALRATCGRTTVEFSAPTQAKVGPIVQVRDSTGAGDAVAAGMLWSVLHGHPLNCSVDIAYVVSRSACQDVGARTGSPTETQLRHRWHHWVGSQDRI